MPITNFLSKALLLLKEQHLYQSQIAERIGMSDVGLSKAKKKGDIKLSTLIKILDLGGYELTIRKRTVSSDVVSNIQSGTFFKIQSLNKIAH